MDLKQKPQFVQLLTALLASYAKPLPEPAILAAWWTDLAPYPLRVVEIAFQAYRDENGAFAPVPAGIAMRCKVMDGRPGAEEAWAIALTSQDEADTVVWSDETAEAFRICRPVLESSGAISARKPFLEAYSRLVAQARAERRPMQVAASLGWDKSRHAAALRQAVTVGMLPAPAVAGLLAGPAGDPATPDAGARAQLARIKEMMAGMCVDTDAKRQAALDQERAADEDWKRRTNEQVAQYQQS